MANIEELVKSSKCFGIAWDGTVKECKICEVKNRCKSKTMMGNGEKPPALDIADVDEVVVEETTNNKVVPFHKKKKEDSEVKGKKEAGTPEKKKVKDKAVEKNYDENMPNFKSLSIDELSDLAKERGIDISEFDKYKAENIKRMRITMALKKTYEK